VVIDAAPVARGGALIDWTRDHSEAFAAPAGLYFNDADLVVDEEGVIALIQGWQAKYKHHNNDIVYMNRFTMSSFRQECSRNAKPETF
jgi:hypothetical protein